MLLVVGGCGAPPGQESEPTASAGGFTTTELPFALLDTATAIAVNGTGDVVVVENGNNGNPGRILLLESDAPAPIQFRSRIVSTDIALSDDGTLYYLADNEVMTTSREAVAGEAMAIGIDPDTDDIEHIGADGAGNVYLHVSQGLPERIVRVAPGVATSEELPIDATEESVDAFTVTPDGTVRVLQDSGDGTRVVSVGPTETASTTADVEKGSDFYPSLISSDNSLIYVNDGQGWDEPAGIVLAHQNPFKVESLAVPITQNGEHLVALGADGSIYVTDDNRVFRLAKA